MAARPGRRLALAFGMLSRLPVPAVEADADEVAASLGWAPAVGLVLGGIATAAAFGAGTLWGPAAGAVTAVAAMAIGTGGLHLDGLADCGDGLGVQGDRERALAVMHDPRAGALGVLTLVIFLAAKFVFCAEGPAWAMVVAAVLARVPLALELRLLPPATPGKGLAGGLAGRVGAGTAAFALLGLGVGLLDPARAGLALFAGAGLSWAWHRLWRRRIGGVSGDVLGGAVELRELVVLAVFAA